MTTKTLDQLLNENIISQRTYDKVILSKKYIERKYNIKSKKCEQLKNFFNELNSYELNQTKINKIKKEIFENQKTKYRKCREKQSVRDYESISIIGRGGFGEVHLCREKNTGEIVAVKKIKKNVLIEKNQVIHVRNEQLFMSNVKSPWIVDLKASFQEGDYLYLVMEYCPGGDLMNVLIKKDILTEKEAKFYMVELILAIESIHKLDCIHRDIKPDNILIDSDGHIKLSDFGLSKISENIFYLNNNINNDNLIHLHNKNYSYVGTVFYAAPEILNKEGYGPEIDWWSAGIIFYEMLIGYAPFCSKEANDACKKVINWKTYLKIPENIKISDEARDLIYKLINHKNKRLGKNGASEIKKHPFFADINWDNVRNMKAPFIPLLDNEYDTKYFSSFSEIEPFYPKIKKNKRKRKDIEYIGYTYKKDNDDYDKKDIFDTIRKTIIEEGEKNKNKDKDKDKESLNNNPNKSDSSKINNLRMNLNGSLKNHRSTEKLSRNKIINNYYNKNSNNKLNIIKLPNKKRTINLNNTTRIKKNYISNFKIISLNTNEDKNRTNKSRLYMKNKLCLNTKRNTPNRKNFIELKFIKLCRNHFTKKSKSNNNNRNKNIKQLNTEKSISHKYSPIILSKKILKNSFERNKISINKNNPIKIINIIENRYYNKLEEQNIKCNNNIKNKMIMKKIKNL